jgi:hypothetical protein
MKIFDEKQYAENLLKDGVSVQKFITLRELVILAKYWRWEKNCSDIEIKENINNFCKKHIPDYGDGYWYDEKIKKAISSSSKYYLRVPKPVEITEDELINIRSLHNYRYEKILFTMLVIGKYYRITNTLVKKNPKENAQLYYLGDLRFSGICRIAHTSFKKDEYIEHALCVAGMISFSDYSKKGSYFLTFTDTNDKGPVAITVTDMNNIIDFYPPYCEACGINLTKKSKMHCMCPDCYNEHRKEIKREWWSKNKGSTRQS